MIFVKRGKTPAIFGSQEIREEREKVARFYSLPIRKREQRRFKWRAITEFLEIRRAIVRLLNNKCAYCESLLGPRINIDTFRPKDGAVGLDGSFEPDHYWWLAFEWSNLYSACSQCNASKANRFPVDGNRLSIGATGKEIDSEQHFLLDPCRDNPEEHLVFAEDGQVISITERGRVTIDVLDLNRDFLVEERRSVIENLQPLWRIVREEYRQNMSMPKGFSIIAEEFTKKTNTYLGLRRQYLRQWADEDGVPRRTIEELAAMRRNSRPEPKQPEAIQQTLLNLEKPIEQITTDFKVESIQREAYSIEDESRKEDYFIKRRLIEKVEISNFRAIKELSILLRASPQDEIETPWLMLLGENGTGKSSILQAIALTLMGEAHRRELEVYPQDILRSGETSGYVRVFLSGSSEPLELSFTRNSTSFEGTSREPKVLLLAYGSTRLPPRFDNFDHRSYNIIRVENLFNPFVPLSNSTSWFHSLSDPDFNRMALATKDLLLLREEDTLVRSSNSSLSVQLQASGTSVSLHNLSDGYQSVVALATDVMSAMSRLWPDMSIAEGMVLIDEIDAHLHPRWKMQIVKRLRQVFPRVQFIVTSHDPLCLRGLQKEEVVVMRRGPENHVTAITDLPDPSALRVDQLLTSEYFGLNSTVDPEIEELFNDYYSLLALRRLNKLQKAKLDELREQLDSLELLGKTRRERMALEAADEYLAEETNVPNPSDRKELEAETKAKLVSIWREIDPQS